MIQEMLETGCTKRDIWEKYTGDILEHGQILRWMRQLGYDESIPLRRPKYVLNLDPMKKQHKSDHTTESFENVQLKNRIEELEKQLKDAEMKTVAFSTMVDIAEKEFNIPIRKKYNTKP